ncbi:complement factor H-like isoform X2 [Hippocampus comes]|uniref:Complement factor H-like n=1 Tax=Hippocampus comes TaxID=109280 RepID=A0A3Q2XEN8_HIPCM|nr:PREDICTED: complement factor H-like isoform X1 [Hippocampus comes]XP_019734717.1 PREDICTED: complement factor H-like isoform X2 [Hippocampus comes]
MTLPDKMFLSCLGLVLVLSHPGVLHAQSSAEHCSAPQLEGGFLVPQLQFYLHESKLAYACNFGQKPAVEGWWATSVCLNGQWSHTPQCIDENACFAPDIPNGKYNESPEGLWYQEGSVIRIKCDEGYKHKGLGATATCTKGAWSALPVCERSEMSCNEPPNIPHAVVLHKYQDIYAGGSEVHYECEDGYSVEGANSRKSVICIAGSWTPAPSCTISKPGPEDDGDTSGGMTKPVDGSRGRGQGGGDTDARVGAPSGGATTGVSTGGSTASETGSVTTSDKTESTNSPLVIAVSNCGSYPKVPNGDVVRKRTMSLRYACNGFYKRVGPETVVCYSDGTWSQLPTCKEAFCQLNLDEYTNYNFQESGTLILKERETKRVQCIWPDFTGRISCTKGQIKISPCCHERDYYYNRCH